jgi:hypothetical protein
MGTRLEIRYYRDAAAASSDEKRETIVGLPQVFCNNNTSTVDDSVQIGKIAKLDINDALASISKFHETTKDGVHTRYRSWEHCYRAFLVNRTNPQKAEYLSLHLACYLASWGMLRNSFLLDFDYLIHLPVVEILTSKRFDPLFENPMGQNIKLVMEASEEIKKGYGRRKLTDTLVTKILLGVFGCTPTYDRYFKNAAIKYNVCIGNFNEISLTQLWGYYISNKDKFEAKRSELDLGGLLYPPMKLLDMCLWQIGYDEDVKMKKMKKILKIEKKYEI